MIWFRQGVAWIPDLEALRAQLAGLRINALTMHVENASFLPPMLSRMTFDALVGAERFGPLHGDVVHISGNAVSVQLDNAARDQLLKALGQAAPAPGGTAEHPTVAPSRGRVRATVAMHYTYEGDDAAEPEPAHELEPEEHPSQASFPAAGSQALAGRIAGTVGLGVVQELFEDQQLAPPGDPATLIHVLRYLHQVKAAGTLTIIGTHYTKRISMARGTPLDINVTPFKEDEQLGQILIKARWITPHRLADVMRRARVNKIAVGQALIESGVLDHAKLERALAHQTYRRLHDLFTWDRARYEFEPGSVELTHTHHPVAVPQLLHEVARDILRQARTDDLLVLLEAYNERFPRMAKISAEYLRHLVSDDKTLRVCRQIFGGDRTLRQAITASVLGRPRTVRLVLYLLAARALELHVDPPASSSQGRKEIAEQHRTIEVQDYFQRLGVAYTVHPDEILPAFNRRAADFAAGSPAHRVDAHTAERIGKLLDEAQLVLTAATSRRRYRERVLGEEKMKLFAKVLKERAEFAHLHGDRERARRLETVIHELS
ncbi:MAG: DUF4388 domain-containing protein [Myxococcales bacterium]|nr:DUF4388 domain-containing protein [Myxococcales bacterium]